MKKCLTLPHPHPKSHPVYKYLNTQRPYKLINDLNLFKGIFLLKDIEPQRTLGKNERRSTDYHRLNSPLRPSEAESILRAILRTTKGKRAVRMSHMFRTLHLL